MLMPDYTYTDIEFIYIAAGIFFFIFGTIIGSFLNVLIYRLPSGMNGSSSWKSAIGGRSRCTSCSAVLGPLDLIPIFSWLFLKGKCRHCKSNISPRYILVELVTGMCFCCAFFTLGINSRLPVALVLFSVLIILSVIDIIKAEIPYWCSGTIAVLGLICFISSFFAPGFFGSFWYEHLIGAVIISLPFAVLAYLGAMGGGDVQLVAAAGFLLGWSIVPSTIIALVIGAVFGISVKISGKSAQISFGPFLSVGIAVGVLWGNELLEWYLGFLK